jgi:molybdopterin adenylyltransferase
MTAHESHRKAGPRTVRFLVIAVSTSRYLRRKAGSVVPEESGDMAEAMISRAGHKVVARDLISDDATLLGASLGDGIERQDVDVVLFTGGTGVSPDDVTIETIRPHFDKEIEGFGEVFRWVSYQEIGGPAMLTRATAGIMRGKLVLCLPGSPGAVETALNLFMRDIPHVLYVAKGGH